MAIHPLPLPFSSSPPEDFELITQGAEALLYRTNFLTSDTICALKVRPSKPWRHPILDKRLTKQRILAETRVLVKLKQVLGSGVPAILGMDWEVGWVAMEWVEGRTVKAAIREREEGSEEALKGMMKRVGEAVGKLHGAGVVHGDLTTSNIMLRGAGWEAEAVLIDFGLAMQSVQEEERAVDLYVLERAFGSTHPREEALFPLLLEGYVRVAGKWGKGVMRRLEDVRTRGRKKSMLG